VNDNCGFNFNNHVLSQYVGIIIEYWSIGNNFTVWIYKGGFSGCILNRIRAAAEIALQALVKRLNIIFYNAFILIFFVKVRL
jgi:hypothetical protein